MMSNLFSYEGLIYKIGDKVFQLLILNILFILTCLPLVTIGAANAALASVTMKMIEGKEGNVALSYLKAFKTNFKLATLVHLSLTVISLLVCLNYIFAGTVASTIRPLVYVALGSVGLLVLVGFSFIYSYIARFNDTARTSVKNTCILILKHGMPSLVVLLVSMLPMVMMILTPLMMVFLIYISAFIGFSLNMYLRNLILLSIYKQYD